MSRYNEDDKTNLDTAEVFKILGENVTISEITLFE